MPSGRPVIGGAYAGGMPDAPSYRSRPTGLLAALLLAIAGLAATWPVSAPAIQHPPVLEIDRVGTAVVELRWAPVPGALGYHIYRTAPPVPAPIPLTERPITTTRLRDRLPSARPVTYQLVVFLTDGRTLRSVRQRVPAHVPAPRPSATCVPATTCARDSAVVPP